MSAQGWRRKTLKTLTETLLFFAHGSIINARGWPRPKCLHKHGEESYEKKMIFFKQVFYEEFFGRGGGRNF